MSHEIAIEIVNVQVGYGAAKQVTVGYVDLDLFYPIFVAFKIKVEFLS